MDRDNSGPRYIPPSPLVRGDAVDRDHVKLVGDGQLLAAGGKGNVEDCFCTREPDRLAGPAAREIPELHLGRFVWPERDRSPSVRGKQDPAPVGLVGRGGKVDLTPVTARGKVADAPEIRSRSQRTRRSPLGETSNASVSARDSFSFSVARSRSRVGPGPPTTRDRPSEEKPTPRTGVAAYRCGAGSVRRSQPRIIPARSPVYTYRPSGARNSALGLVGVGAQDALSALGHVPGPYGPVPER